MQILIADPDLWAERDLPTIPRWVKQRLAAGLRKRTPTA